MMGAWAPFHKSSFCSCSKKEKVVVKETPKSPNPDPSNFIFIRIEEIGNYVVAMVEYPDCVNYEGRKILFFENITKDHLLAAKKLDPHFCDNPGCLSPVARFVPTDQGFKSAVILAELLSRLEKVGQEE